MHLFAIIALAAAASAQESELVSEAGTIVARSTNGACLLSSHWVSNTAMEETSRGNAPTSPLMRSRALDRAVLSRSVPVNYGNWNSGKRTEVDLWLWRVPIAAGSLLSTFV